MRRLVTVTVDDAHVGAIDEVAGRLRDAGMEVASVLAAVGIITGSVPVARMPAIEAVEGVAAVQEQTSFKLAPPDADVQ